MMTTTTTLKQFQEYLSLILGCAERDLPAVFRGQRPRVLAVGIFIDLQRAYPGVNRVRLSEWLRHYTTSDIYLKRKVRAEHRNDLYGRNVARIAKASKRAAELTLAQRDPQGVPQRLKAATSASEAAHAA